MRWRRLTHRADNTRQSAPPFPSYPPPMPPRDPQLSLLGPEPVPTLPDADLRLHRGFLAAADADRLLDQLLHQVAWRADVVTVYGKQHPQPRLTQWFGPPGLDYAYSGVKMAPVAWPDWLIPTRARVEACSGAAFNTALANLYRDGSDAMGWHADDEPELGRDPVIASLSLGVTRDFRLKHRHRADVPPVTLPLHHGDLLIMAGPTQHHWLHSLPRRRRVTQPRVNLTFRALHHSPTRRRR